MTFFGASDIAGMLSDFGVPIAFGAVQGLGIRDEVDEEMLQDSERAAVLVGRVISVTVMTSVFGAIAEGASVTVDGVAMRVVGTRRIDDGALTRLLCARVS